MAMHSFSVTLLGLCIYGHLGPSPKLTIDDLYVANRNIFIMRTAESPHLDLTSRCSFESIDRTWALSYLPWRVWTLGNREVSLHGLPLSDTRQNTTTFQYSYKEVRLFVCVYLNPCSNLSLHLTRIGHTNKVFRNTKLAQWHHEGQWNRSNRTQYMNLVHAIRFALLYKYGGIVTDFDMLWFERVDMARLGRNFVGIESGSKTGTQTNCNTDSNPSDSHQILNLDFVLSSRVFAFERGHPFLAFWMVRLHTAHTVNMTYTRRRIRGDHETQPFLLYHSFGIVCICDESQR